MVQHNRWFITEIENEVYRGKFVDYGWSYSDMKIQVRRKVKIVPNWIEFWIWKPLNSLKSLKIGAAIVIDRQQYYEDKDALELIKRGIKSNKLMRVTPSREKPKHSPVIGDGSRIDKINKILGV